MPGRLEGKVAIVTGAGTRGDGIGNGKACAILYAREGAKVVAADIDMDSAQATADQINAEGGECIATRTDVSRTDDCRAMIDGCIAAFGKLDVLHNNVGITESGGPVEYAEEQWDRMMRINAKSVYLTAKFSLPHMERSGSGSIVNIASINGVRTLPFAKLGYAASKAAMIAISREIAIQYAAKGIRSNVVLVGLIKSPIVVQNNTQLYGGDVEQMWATRDAMSPTGKQGEVWDIAQASLFLASDESRYVNGTVLPVDGGLINMVKF
ncbi:NAD(P)-dependent oxidoreductase [Sphingobium amiense]|uniref:NAD(P)-dependent oxidoreductase n=1 Tax=Sphingobium amiense TaxID=135719 RepID=A0A494W146_9SPHN|nr:SDR family NAD(P)-dependent oxidoreductase [Sphingobium amiense]BBD98383.1 NAD(P)-dependent oxidoreductase [Sphingobium amiense]